MDPATDTINTITGDIANALSGVIAKHAPGTAAIQPELNAAISGVLALGGKAFVVYALPALTKLITPASAAK